METNQRWAHKNLLIRRFTLIYISVVPTIAETVENTSLLLTPSEFYHWHVHCVSEYTSPLSIVIRFGWEFRIVTSGVVEGGNTGNAVPPNILWGTPFFQMISGQGKR